MASESTDTSKMERLVRHAQTDLEKALIEAGRLGCAPEKIGEVRAILDESRKSLDAAAVRFTRDVSRLDHKADTA
jgi:hypothetical protein